MFTIPIKLDKNFEEGVVMEVDAERMICKVHTVFGKKLSRVKWMLQYGGSSRAGDRGTPSQGDRVVLMYGLGSPVIIGCIPELEGGRDDSMEIVNETFSVDTGNFTGVAGASSKIDANKPRDFIAGDRIFSSVGGAILGILRGGSLLLRSGPFSEIFISKLKNLVRIVSGNWEHFTDVCSDVIKNYRGRVYRYTGYTNNYTDSKSETYSYHEYTGDTALAELMKTSYTEDVIPPAVTDIIRKEQIKAASIETMRRELGLAGFEETVITNNGGVTRIRSKGDEVYVSHTSPSDVGSIVVIDVGGILLKTGVTNGTPKASFHSDAAGNISVIHDGNLDINTKGTSTIHSDGNMVINSGGTSTIHSDGNMVINSGGTSTIHSDGDMTATVSGALNVTSTGKATVKGANVDIDGGGGSMGGVVQANCLCSFTGAPHPQVSSTVKGSI